MPELPEVETTRCLLEKHCVGKQITNVIAAEDEIVFEGVAPSAVSSAFLHKTPLAARRLGKHCWLDFGPSSPALVLHLGMAGGTIIRGASSMKMKRYFVDDGQGWPPRFCKLQLHFEDGTEWALCDSRRFARIRLVKDPTSVPPLSLLGWDPLLSWPSLGEFTAALEKQRRAIKAVLLDQSFSPGVGNWVADEVLYQALVHPEQPANSLTPQQAQQVHHWVREVCRVASEAGSEAERLPGSWLFHVRWGKGAATKSKINGHVIDHITVGGRTSAYVPALQKLVKTAAVGAAKKKSGGASQKKRQANEDGGDDGEDNEEVVEKTVKKKVKRVAAEVPEMVATPLSTGKKKESTGMNTKKAVTTTAKAVRQQAPPPLPTTTATTSRTSKIVRAQQQPFTKRNITTRGASSLQRL